MGKSDKSNGLQGKRRAAEGKAYERTERSQKKADNAPSHEQRRKEAEAKAKPRVGKPQAPLLGRRTRQDKYRGTLRVNQFMTLISRGESSTIADKLFIPGFNLLLGDQCFALILRFFINPIYSFYGYSQLRNLIFDFVHRFNLNVNLPVPVQFKIQLKELRNNRIAMEQCVERYGPAFLPTGTVVVNNKIEHIHRIPITDGSLMFAQLKFLAKHPITVDQQFFVRGRGKSKPKPKPAPPPTNPSPVVAKPSAPSVPTAPKKKKKKKKNKNDNSTDKVVVKDSDKKSIQAKSEKESTILEKPDLSLETDKTAQDFNFRQKLEGIRLHKTQDVNNVQYLDTLIPVECNGAPYCGFVSVDLCVGKIPVFGRYEKMRTSFGFADPYDMGTPQHLADYCISENVNLLIVKSVEELEAQDYGRKFTKDVLFHNYVPLYRTLQPSLGPWVILRHSGPVDDGHYVPFVANKKVEVMPIPEPDYPEPVPLIYLYREEHKIVQTMIDTSNVDLRQPNMRREKIEQNDSYSMIGIKKMFYISKTLVIYLLLLLAIELVYRALTFEFVGFVKEYESPFYRVFKFFYGIFDRMFYHEIRYSVGFTEHTIKRLQRLYESCSAGSCYDIGPFVYIIYDFKRLANNCRLIATVWYVVALCLERAGFHLGCFEYQFDGSKYVVSNMLTRVLDTQLQNTPLETVNWDVMTRLKYVDTNCTVEGILLNTKQYIIEVFKYRKKVVPTQHKTRGLVALNTLSSTAFLSPETLSVIGANQALGKIRGSGNYVVKAKLGRDSTKVDVPIACCPIGCPVTDQGPIGPGLLPVTDGIGVLIAFCGRSMIREDYDDPIIDEFINFSIEFLKPFIEGTDCTGLYDEEPIPYFRSHYRGKRSTSWIDGMINQFQFYSDGFADISFDTNSCFVKLENSAKRVGGEYTIKPRLIMTMSPVMLFRCCQILKVIDRWNMGPFSRFQVKDMKPEDMIRKIIDMSDRAHMVTDYSSFESSITAKIRTIENFVINELLTKAGMNTTKAYFQQYASGERTLKSHGLTLNIESRCSGDPHTSCGNGIVNVCLAAFCASKNGIDVANTEFIVAEGDDGLIPQEVANVDLIGSVGFKFSTDVSGVYPGDTDFLRRRWIDNKAFLNIGRAMSVFWVKNKSNLSLNKQKFILRCMGCSLHHMSPGHPVLFAIVNRIGIETAGITKFKNWFLHIDMYRWPDFDVDNYPTNVVCDESMRADIDSGAIGFPPISIQQQHDLERIFMFDEQMYIGHLLGQYEEVECFVDSLKVNREQRAVYSDSVLELLRIVGVENF